MVGTGWGGCRVYANGGSGRGTGVGGRGDIQDGYGDRLSRWEDNVANVTLGMEPNVPLVYAPVLEHLHPIMITLDNPGGQLDRDRRE